MLRDVFYYGIKPNVHPREQFANNLNDARKKCTTEHFWIVNEYCDYTNFDWDFDFDFLPDEDVWAQDHNNVWPSQHQKDSGTRLCSKMESDIIIYRTDVNPVKRKNEKNSHWKIYSPIDEKKFDFSWHPDPTDPLFIFVWGNKYINAVFEPTVEYHMPGATEKKYMFQHAPVLPQWERWHILKEVDKTTFDFSWRPDPREPAYIYTWGNKYEPAEITPTLMYHMPTATEVKYMTERVDVLPQWDRWIEHTPVDKKKSTKNGFDFSWRPDPREPAFNYVWGNKFEDAEMVPTLEYRMPDATQVKYMTERVDVLPQLDRWIIPDNVDKTTFDFTWRPDPREPALVYEFGTQWQKTGGPKYVMPDATEVKYIDVQCAKVLPNPSKDNWIIPDNIDVTSFDFSWHPDSTDEPYVYQFGTQHQKTGGPKYVDNNATQIKYIDVTNAKALPNKDRWIVPDNLDVSEFDFSWHPDDTDPPFIYDAGTQWQKTGGPRYIVEGATQLKYLENKKAKALPNKENWHIPVYIDEAAWDFSWHPDITEPAYIYYFPTQWALSGGPVYTVPGGAENKFLEGPVAKAVINMDNWEIPDNIHRDSFDFSWHPFAQDDPCIYQIGTQWQKTGGPRYITPGTNELSPVKYIDRRIIKSKILPDKSNFKFLHPIVEEEFDFSWHPDSTEEPYTYIFGNQHWGAEKMHTIEYHVEGATQYKYVYNLKAKLKPNRENWQIKINIDESTWDFSWMPDPGEPAYIYVFGNQWHNAEIESTVEYHVPGATEYKYMNDIKATVLPDMTNWKFNYKIDKKKFDFSWRPDPGSPPYIYVFGSNLYPAEEMSTVEYHVPGATDYKYISELVAQLAEDKSNWVIPDNVDVTDFDFTWHPNPKDPAYIYYAGTQWQKTGGPKYVVEGATEIKYLECKKVKALPDKTNWVLPTNVDVADFDFSWHPDETEPPYVYQFGTQWALSGGPKYVMPDATEVKYMENPVAKAIPDKTNWIIPKNIDANSFDFSWHPYVEDQPYIYVFGTQWQKTGGPRYVTPGSTEMSPVKYIDRRIIKSKRLPDKTNWSIPDNIDPNSVDYSWHPDDTEQPYIYEFRTQWHNRGGPKYIVPDATVMKYSSDIKGNLIRERKNWEVLTPIIESKFDFTWHPHPDDPPYIYVFGNNLYPAEEMETVRYVVEGAVQVKYVNDIVAQLAPDRSNWEVPKDVDVSEFDFSWRPHPKAPPYIYEFGTQWQKTGGPRYIVEGAKEVNYISGSKAIYKPKIKSKYWEIPKSLDIKEFDFSWHPDSTDKPYIFQFGTQWALSGGPRFVVPGATEVKYIEKPVAKMRGSKRNWEIPDDVDVSEFDFSWHPYEDDKPYIYQFGTQWQKTGGPRYITPGSDEMSAVKYIDRRILKAKKLPNKKNFTILNNNIVEDFDYSWHPDDTDPPYIYIFGNEKYNAEIMPTIQYTVEGAQTKKYISDVKAKLGVNMSNWKIPSNVDTKDFDFSWVPDPLSPPYIYEFATIWNDRGGPIYTVPNATEKKYITDIKAKLLPNRDNWNIIIPIEENKFDFSWMPHPDSPPYSYVFGNQWNRAEKESTVEYRVPGATEYKYVHDIIATTLPTKDNWKINIPVDKSFDFSWRPDPNDPPYIYVFGNQWNKAEKESTVEYTIPGATDKKYIQDIIANVAENLNYWKIPADIDVSDFDFSWRPDSGAPPYIYQFGTLENDNDGPIYHTPENKGEIVRVRRVYKKYSANKTSVGKYFITTTLQDLVEQHPDELFWALRENIDYTNFDFDWSPNIEQARYVHVFGSPESEITQTYFVSGPMWKDGYRDFNFIEQDKKASEEYLAELFVQPDIFFVDRGNPETQQRFEQLKARFTNISKTRFLNSWVDTINRCINRSNTELCWILNSELDYTDFDFKYYPNPWQMKMVHVFGTQWSHWGTTFMVNRETFSEDTKYIKIIEHLSNLNFVKDRRARATNNLYDIYVINHGNTELNQVVDSIKLAAGDKSVNVVDYDKTYLQTIKNIVDNINPRKEHYIWICSSICNYSNFDFTYVCDPFARENLHVFPSDMQKFGDTFFINVNHTKKVISELEVLQQYNKVNFNNTVKTRRLPAPVVKVNTDTHVGSIDTNFDFPYAIFTTEEFKANDIEPLNLWQDDTKELLVTSTGASRIIVPKEAKNYIKNELYDYPYIKTASKLLSSKPLDIVFLSNGEKNAEENYKHLLAVTEGLKNRIVRVDGVNGRVDAYHAAVKASETPWTFTVFAKLKVNGKFDWGWQPDRLQVPKHYIFHAKNPVNGLEYGHQGMIAYNKQLVLNNFGSGLDFTLDDPHETVELVSGTANFNTDAYSTWRTAFREVIKLKSDYTEISQERLNIWLTEAKGKFAKDCLQGAKDAVEYYEQVSGDMDQLKLSYEWSWLKDFYNRKYK